MYTSPTADIIRKHGLKYHCYAYDTQIYISVDPTQSNVNNAIEQIVKSQHHTDQSGRHHGHSYRQCHERRRNR